MKIALLTYFASSSYGATLQTYATIKILKDLGHEVELVNYVIPESPRSKIKNILLMPKMLGLKRFREKRYGCSYSRPYKTIEELQNNPPNADVYMVGSDQTWNSEISREKARGIFLDFGDDKIKRVTYAASFGKEVWTDNQWMTKDDAKKLLSKFDSILIREKSGQMILKEMFGISAEQVLDPVLLYKGYPELTGTLQETNEIVTFKLLDSQPFYNKMIELSKAVNLPIRILGSLRRKKGFRCSYPESIEQWVRKIGCSKYVITDSFHAMVVAMLHHRQFVVLKIIPERFTRLMDLLSMLHLDNRIISLEDDIHTILNKLQRPINWNEVDLILDENRAKSIQFLKEELLCN